MTNQEKSFVEACFFENMSSIKACYKHKVDIHIEDNWAIKIAAEKGYKKLILWLLNNGVTHEVANDKNLLSWACHYQLFEVVFKLTGESDAYKKDRSAFGWTASTGNLNIAELLIQYLDREVLHSAFIRASEKGNIEFLEFLLANNMEDLDESSKRAVRWAAEKGRWKTIEYLLQNSIGNVETLGKYKSDYFAWKESNEV